MVRWDGDGCEDIVVDGTALRGERYASEVLLYFHLGKEGINNMFHTHARPSSIRDEVRGGANF